MIENDKEIKNTKCSFCKVKIKEFLMVLKSFLIQYLVDILKVSQKF